MNYSKVKRGADVLMAGTLLVTSLPVQAVVAATVRARLGSPVLFRQERSGKDAQPFWLVKFRTMHEVDESRGMVTDADRLTTLGKFLRSTSLDELPSLWNVLRGDMSMVGPRPLRCYYDHLYSPEQADRFLVRPGITGLSQVKGRNALGWPEKLAYDAEYARNPTLRGDLSILVRTVKVVLLREGISAEGYVTMPRFTGNEPSMTVTPDRKTI